MFLKVRRREAEPMTRPVELTALHGLGTEAATTKAEPPRLAPPGLMQAFWGDRIVNSGSYTTSADFDQQGECIQSITGAPELRTVSQHVSVEMIHWDDYQEASAGCVHGGNLVDSPLNEGMLTAVKRVCPYVVERFPESAGAVRAAGKVEVGDIVSQTTCQMPPLAHSEDTHSVRTADMGERWGTCVGSVERGAFGGPVAQTVCVDDEVLLINDHMRLLVPSAAKVELPAPSVLDLVRRPQENALLEEMLSMAQLCHRPTVGTSCTYTRTQPLVTAAWGGGVWRMEKGETGVVTGVNGYGEARLRKEDGSESTWLAHNVAGVDPHSQAGRPRLCLPKAVVLGLLPAAVSIGFALPAVPSSARDELLQSLFRVIGAPGFPGDLRDTDFHAIVSGLSAVQGWSDRHATRLCVHCHCLMRLCVRTVAVGAIDACLHAGLLLGIKRSGNLTVNVLRWLHDVLHFRQQWQWRPRVLDLSADNVVPILQAMPSALDARHFDTRAELLIGTSPPTPTFVGLAGDACVQLLRLLAGAGSAGSSNLSSSVFNGFPLSTAEEVMQKLQLEQLIRSEKSESGLSGVVNLVVMMLGHMGVGQQPAPSGPTTVLNVGSLYEHAVLGTEEAAAGIRDTRTEVKALLLCAGRNPEKYGDQRSLWMQVGEYIPGGALPWPWCRGRLLYCLQSLACFGGLTAGWVTFNTGSMRLSGSEFALAVRGLVTRAVRQSNSAVLRTTGIRCIEVLSASFSSPSRSCADFAVCSGLLRTDLDSSHFTRYLAALGTVCTFWKTDRPLTVCRFVSLDDMEVSPSDLSMQVQIAAASVMKGVVVHWTGSGLFIHAPETGTGAVPLRSYCWDDMDDDKIIKSLVHVRRRVVEVGAESNLLADRVAVGGHNPMRSQLILEVHQFCERALRQGRREVRLQVLEWLVGLTSSANDCRLCEPELRLFLPLVQDSLSEWRVEDGCDLPACTAAFSIMQTSYVCADGVKPITFFMATDGWASAAEKALAETERIVSRFAGHLIGEEELRELPEGVRELVDGGMLDDTAAKQFTQVAARSLQFLLSISCVESQAIPDSGPQRNDPAHLRGLSELEFSRMYGVGGKEQWDKAQLHTHSYPAERCVEAVRGTLHKLMPLLARLPAFAARLFRCSWTMDDWQQGVACGLMAIQRCCAVFPDAVKEHAVDIVRALALRVQAEGPGRSTQSNAAAVAIGCVLNVAPEAAAVDLHPLEVSSEELASCAGGDFSVFIQAEHTASMTEVSLPADATVGEFRRRAAALLGLGTGRVQLFYQGELLPSDQTALADSGLSAESVVQTRVETECHLWMPQVLAHFKAQGFGQTTGMNMSSVVDAVCLGGTPVRGRLVDTDSEGPNVLEPWNAASGMVRALDGFARESVKRHYQHWRMSAVPDVVSLVRRHEKCSPVAKVCAEEMQGVWDEAHSSNLQANASPFGMSGPLSGGAWGQPTSVSPWQSATPSISFSFKKKEPQGTEADSEAGGGFKDFAKFRSPAATAADAGSAAFAPLPSDSRKDKVAREKAAAAALKFGRAFDGEVSEQPATSPLTTRRLGYQKTRREGMANKLTEHSDALVTQPAGAESPPAVAADVPEPEKDGSEGAASPAAAAEGAATGPTSASAAEGAATASTPASATDDAAEASPASNPADARRGARKSDCKQQ